MEVQSHQNRSNFEFGKSETWCGSPFGSSIDAVLRELPFSNYAKKGEGGPGYLVDLHNVERGINSC